MNDAQGHDSAKENRLYAIRFVLDKPSTIYRFFSGFNVEGVYTNGSGGIASEEIRTKCQEKRTEAACPGKEFNSQFQAPPASLPGGWSKGTGRIGYAHGNGGEIWARLVPMKEDGTPNLAGVIAEEKFNPVDRYAATKSAYGISGKTGMLYVGFGGASVAADTPYFVVYTNIAAKPEFDYVSFNSPVTNAGVAGPNGTNTLNPDATGAIAGLDPREAVAWSTNGGLTWGWGKAVGSGSLFGDYEGAGDSAVKLPWYAWQATAESTPEANQPYYAYTEAGEYTLSVTNGPRAATVTEAGGYAPEGSTVGAVTVTAKSGSAKTAVLGTGLQKGALGAPVQIAPGETFTISNVDAGAVRKVAKAEGDAFLQKLGLIGSGRPYATAGNEYDRAELFVYPHPLFAEAPNGYYATVKSTADLHSYWRLDETSGSTATDSMEAVSGTYSSATLGAPGLVGSSDPAISFAGTSNRMQASTSSYGFPGTSAFTVEATVEPTTVDSTSRRIFSSEVLSGGSVINGYGLWNNGTVNKLQACRIPSGSYDCATTSAAASGVAKHVAATYDGTTVKLYVDGVQVASTTSKGSITAPSTFTVGARSDFAGSWAGVIDDAAVYDRALSAAEVKDHAAAAGY
ncbi:MAG TPA: LamG domain-containing protein [Solirubrobacterales bacterium]|nr:LamG domain-containing protein [Solirubrobacterales bacterium]